MASFFSHRLFGKTLRVVLLVLLFMATAGIGAYVVLTLIIKGEATVVVPDLVGRDVLYSLETLSDLGLNTRVRETVFDDRVPRNHVIDQSPDPGASIKRGREVRIRVSRGPEAVIVPNLSGLSLQQSRILLTENGLCQGTVARLPQAGTTDGQVIAQHPTAGDTLVRRHCVDLLVSRGAPLAAMAMIDLAGIRADTALARLQRLQLRVGAVSSVRRPDLAPDSVVDQTPAAGWRVAPGHRVTLSVNRPSADDGASADDAAASGLYRFSPGNGFYKKRVRVEGGGAPLAAILFDDWVAPGQEIWLLIPKNGNPSVRVFVDGLPVDPLESVIP